MVLEYEIDHVRDKDQRFEFSLQVIDEITKHMIKKKDQDSVHRYTFFCRRVLRQI